MLNVAYQHGLILSSFEPLVNPTLQNAHNVRDVDIGYYFVLPPPRFGPRTHSARGIRLDPLHDRRYHLPDEPHLRHNPVLRHNSLATAPHAHEYHPFASPLATSPFWA
jgi:hypothetical protein